VLKAIRQSGVTIFLVEQNVNAALRLADRAYVLEMGRVTLEGTGRELLSIPACRRPISESDFWLRYCSMLCLVCRILSPATTWQTS